MTERLKKIAEKYSINDPFLSPYQQVLGAIKEAIEGLTPEEVHNLCHDLEKTVSLEEFDKGCQNYQKKLFGRCHRNETI